MNSDSKKLVQFGAGNIGRSFIGQLFSLGGYEVVFVDIDKPLLKALHRKRSYRIEIRDRESETIIVQNVRGVDAADIDAVAKEIADANICATAVGPLVLPKLFSPLAKGIKLRHKLGRKPIDIILCENLRNAASIMRDGIRRELPADFPIESYVGLVETSIGKMVPIIPPEKRAGDPLTVYAEAYNNLILDKKGFINEIPDVGGLVPKENMKAHVDRKSFIHNFGHAALAYYTFMVSPFMQYTYEAVEDPELRSWVKNAMWESGRLLIKMYPDEFNERNQEEYIEDLLNRFGNRALGDTIHRVGRDLQRKLSPNDRVAGPLIENEKHKLAAPWNVLALSCSLFFQAPGPDGMPFQSDRKLLKDIDKKGNRKVLKELCQLSEKMISLVDSGYELLSGYRKENTGISRNQFLSVFKHLNKKQRRRPLCRKQ